MALWLSPLLLWPLPYGSMAHHYDSTAQPCGSMALPYGYMALPYDRCTPLWLYGSSVWLTPQANRPHGQCGGFIGLAFNRGQGRAG